MLNNRLNDGLRFLCFIVVFPMGGQRGRGNIIKKRDGVDLVLQHGLRLVTLLCERLVLPAFCAKLAVPENGQPGNAEQNE
ncbi:hypothetical protein ERD95_07315 [Enterobacteriaceae bacterium ML5]|nr:hypothetical protein ERD95_07315 [Enterobacteriaceae bacterium ML5]